jgi:hypothetical protein
MIDPLQAAKGGRCSLQCDLPERRQLRERGPRFMLFMARRTDAGRSVFVHLPSTANPVTCQRQDTELNCFAVQQGDGLRSGVGLKTGGRRFRSFEDWRPSDCACQQISLDP